ncbi:MAG TPA: ankyrin repeat domain-containing protein [Blastocatellia bacterium]|nr:ankyrin repeat domain-containing protein [Blastocatellia bacterium]
MPKQLSILDRVQITQPCTADWDSMIGNDKVRFCEHCAKDVHNISRMTRAQALLLIARSEGRLCLRYHRSPDGSVATVDRPARFHQISRKVSRVAAGAFAAALSLSSNVTAIQPDFKSTEIKTNGNLHSKKTLRNRTIVGNNVSGTVKDGAGRAVPGAEITLTGATLGSEWVALADKNGEFSFNEVEPGIYVVVAFADTFDLYQQDNIEISASGAKNLAVVLHLTEKTTIRLGGVLTLEPKNLLVLAAMKNDLGGVRSLLDVGLDVNSIDDATERTALQEAVGNNNLEMVKLLVSAGAGVNGVMAPAKVGKNENVLKAIPLNAISGETSVEIVDLLISEGADVGLAEWDGRFPLLTSSGIAKPEVIKELISRGADVNQDDGSFTPLMYAAVGFVPENLDVLIKAGADVNHRNDANSALTLTISEHKVEAFRILINAGAKVDFKDEFGTALMMAADENDPVFVKLLIEKGAPVNEVNNEGLSALMVAAEYDNFENVKMLISAGANVNQRDKDGNTALSRALRKRIAADKSDVVQYLREHGAVY